MTRLAGRPPLVFVLCAAMICLGSAPGWAKSFGGSSARGGENELYFENRSFGTNIGAGSAFSVDPETGDRHFKTLPMPQNEEPETIEILPIQPEIHPMVPAAKPPIIIQPGN